MKKNINDLFKLPSNIEPLDLSGFGINRHEILIKRDDLIHEVVSGNKWRKLKYNIQDFIQSNKKGVITFGGPHSNHIDSLAYIANLLNISSVAIIRGEKPIELSPTLNRCKEMGMKLCYIQRSFYANQERVYKWVAKKFADYYIIPEGGFNRSGIKGCNEIVEEIDVDFDEIYCDVGTGATCAGISSALNVNQIVKGIVVLKGSEYLYDHINKLLKYKNTRFQLIYDYHMGGYAKNNNELIRFMQYFYDQTGIKTDPVYSGKMFYGLIKELQKDVSVKSNRVIALHSGGLQGLEGFEKRYGLKIYT